MANHNPPTEAQLAARFKPGWKGGNGRPKVTKEIIEARKITSEAFANAMVQFGTMTPSELRKKLKGRKTTVIEMVFGRLLVDAMSGKIAATQLIFDRLFGKVTNQIQFEGLSPNAQVVISLPPKEDPPVNINIEKIEQVLEVKS